MKNLFHNILSLYNWLSKKRKNQFFLIIFFSIIVSILEMIAIGSVVPFVSSILSSDSSFGLKFIQFLKSFLTVNNKEELIIILALVFVLFSIITGFCRSILIYAVSRYSNIILAEMATSIYSQKLNEPFLRFISNSSDKLISLISSKLFQVYDLINGILLIITSTILFISIMAILLFIDFQLTMISLIIFGTLYLLVVLSFRRMIMKNSRTISQNQTLMVKSLQEGIGSIRDIILDSNQEIYTKSFSELVFERGIKVAINDVVAQSPRFLLETVGIILISTFLFFSGSKNGVLALFPVLSALALGAQKIMPLMNTVYVNYSTVVSNSHQLNEAVKILKEMKKDLFKASKKEDLLFEKKIVLKDVYFQYNDNSPLILKGINFEILKGSKIGIIGKTGRGKSTLLDIIMSLLNPTSGYIFIDDKLLKNENLQAWRKKITHVPQDIFLINGTILENVTLTLKKDDIDIKKVIRSLEISGILDLIETLPNKLDEVIGERGVKLSGGQKQRIGIARALYRKSDLIILDEATNALDLYTEKKIIDQIINNYKHKTILMVSHRIDTLKNCDKVFKLENNNIIETKI